MAANESRARLIKETSLMQERGEAGEGGNIIFFLKKTQHMLDRNQNNRNKLLLPKKGVITRAKISLKFEM